MRTSSLPQVTRRQIHCTDLLVFIADHYSPALCPQRLDAAEEGYFSNGILAEQEAERREYGRPFQALSSGWGEEL